MKHRESFGVIFDMDGVLIDSAAPHLQSWRLLAAELGTQVSEQQCAALFGRQNRDIIPALFGETTPERIQALADRKELLYRDLVRRDPPIVEGAVDLIRALHETGARLAIGSSAPRANIDLVLSAMDVSDLMHAVVSGDEVSRGKPDPQVFQMACERLALTPGRCVVVEDAPVGITAAKAAGTHAVAVLMHHSRESFVHSNLIVDELRQLTPEMLAALVQRPAS